MNVMNDVAHDPEYPPVAGESMYTACTFRLAKVGPIPLLTPIPRAFVYIALAAWAVTFVRLLRSLVAGFRASAVR